ncbi:MAG: ABC transporter ATP-binding protein [Eubacteriales bacterium]
MKNNIKKTFKYIMLSVKLIVAAGKAHVILWVIAIIIPPIIEILKKIINANMIDGIYNLLHGGSVFIPLISLCVLVLVSAGYNIFYKIQSRVFWILAQSADEQMMLYVMEKSSGIKQISFDSASRFDKIKDSIGSDLSLWDLNCNLMDFITTSVTIVGSIVIVKNYNIKLVAVAFVFSVPFYFISNILRKYDAESNMLSRRKTHVMGYYLDMLTGVKAAKEIRLFGIQEYMLSIWHGKHREFQKEDERIAFRQMCFSLVLIIVEILYSFLIYFVCAKSVIDKTITVGEFYLFSANFFLMFEAFQQISETIRSTLNISHEYDAFEKFTKETEEGERTGAAFVPTEMMSIRFENVSFHYEDEPVLRDISFEWKTGENIALIGRNGCGKSTLIKLICGLYECDKGTIYINDVDVNEYAQGDLYKLFGVVYQDFCHYQLPLRTILASQRLDALYDDDALWEVFDRVDCSEVKKQLTNGLDTPLGREYDDGVELSGGQWQKLAIARNYYGNRPFLIFDEPSAALDPKAEFKIIEDLLSHTEKMELKSVLVISHRLSVGKLVDRILYLEDGRIVEQGTHDELMSRNGSYAKMYNTQASLYERG